MLSYLLAVLVAPLVRSLLRWFLILMGGAFAATMPARLWIWCVGLQPTGTILVTLNALGFVLLGVSVVYRVHRRCKGRHALRHCRAAWL